MILDKFQECLKILAVLDLYWPPKQGVTTGRNFHAFSLRLEGNGQFQYRDQMINVTKGDIVFVPKGLEYILDAQSYHHVIVIHFDLNIELPKDILIFRPENTGIYEILLKRMHEIWQLKHTGYQYAATAVFFQFLEALVKDSTQDDTGSADNKLSYIVEHIHNHYTDPDLNISVLTAMFGASATYFRRVFKDKFGISPLQYINNLRLNRAKELLSSGYYTVAEAARFSGFSDPKYFSRFVKKETGTTPSKMKGTQINE